MSFYLSYSFTKRGGFDYSYRGQGEAITMNFSRCINPKAGLFQQFGASIVCTQGASF